MSGLVVQKPQFDLNTIKPCDLVRLSPNDYQVFDKLVKGQWYSGVIHKVEAFKLYVTVFNTVGTKPTEVCDGPAGGYAEDRKVIIHLDDVLLNKVKLLNLNLLSDSSFTADLGNPITNSNGYLRALEGAK